MSQFPFRPRNDYCLVEIVDVGETSTGIAIPQISIEGKEFYVRAVGSEVDDLEPGDRVLMIGKQGTEYFPLPRSNKLLMIKQEYIVLVMGQSDAE